MPTKASSATKNKGKVFFVAKSSGPLLGRLPLNMVFTLKHGRNLSTVINDLNVNRVVDERLHSLTGIME